MIEDIFEKAGVIKLLLYLYDHPEGKRKTDFRKDLDLGPGSAIKAHKICYEAGLITTIPSLDEMKFILSKSGEKVTLFLKGISYYIENQIPIKENYNIFGRILDMVQNELILKFSPEPLTFQNFFNEFIEIIEEWNIGLYHINTTAKFDFQKLELYKEFWKFIGLIEIDDERRQFELLNKYYIFTEHIFPKIKIIDKITGEELAESERHAMYSEIAKYAHETWQINVNVVFPQEELEIKKKKSEKIKKISEMNVKLDDCLIMKPFSEFNKDQLVFEAQCKGITEKEFTREDVINILEYRDLGKRPNEMKKEMKKTKKTNNSNLKDS